MKNKVFVPISSIKSVRSADVCTSGQVFFLRFLVSSNFKNVVFLCAPLLCLSSFAGVFQMIGAVEVKLFSFQLCLARRPVPTLPILA